MGQKISLKDASKVTGLSETELRKGFKMGKYPGLRLGSGIGKILFDKELLEARIEELMLSNQLS